MEPTDSTALGQTVRRLRTERGWSQAELAKRATRFYGKGKVDPSHLSRIESGEYESPRRRLLVAIASALNVEIEELTGRETIRQVTPYESNPLYRELIDKLEEVASVEDRDEIVRHGIWAATLAAVRSAAPMSAPTRDATAEGLRRVAREQESLSEDDRKAFGKALSRARPGSAGPSVGAYQRLASRVRKDKK